MRLVNSKSKLRGSLKLIKTDLTSLVLTTTMTKQIFCFLSSSLYNFLKWNFSQQDSLFRYLILLSKGKDLTD